MMNINDQTCFIQVYQAYLNTLVLQGLSPKTVDMYNRYLHQTSVFFDTRPDALTAAELSPDRLAIFMFAALPDN